MTFCSLIIDPYNVSLICFRKQSVYCAVQELVHVLVIKGTTCSTTKSKGARYEELQL